MKRSCIFLLALWAGGLCAQGNVGIGTQNADPSALLELRSTRQGMSFTPLSKGERDAIQQPPEGLLIFNTSSGCLERYNTALNLWECIAGGGPFKVVDTRRRDGLNPQVGTTVYNADTKCLETYTADGSWLCSRKAPGREEKASPPPSLFFTKNEYPVACVIGPNGEIEGRAMGSFRIDTLPIVHSLGGYGYKVTLGGNQKLLGVTASYIALNSGQWEDIRYSKLYSIKIQESAARDGFSYYIYDRRSVMFIAFVKGDALPDYARYLAPIGGSVLNDGNIYVGSDLFSSEHPSTGTYKILPKGMGYLRFLTAIEHKNYDKLYDIFKNIKIYHPDSSGFWLRTSTQNIGGFSHLANMSQSFLGIVDYKNATRPVKTLPQVRIIHGALDANGRIAQGSGFSVSSITTRTEDSVTRYGYKIHFAKVLLCSVEHPLIKPGYDYYQGSIHHFANDTFNSYFYTDRWSTRKSSRNTKYPITFTALVRDTTRN